MAKTAARLSPEFLILLVGTGFGGFLILAVTLLPPDISDNESSAQVALQLVAKANAEFRANDLDKNGVNDFWVGDLGTLFEYGLISRQLANADAAPLKPLFPRPIPYHGYYFRVLQKDASSGVAVRYQLDTDGTRRLVHNPSCFGFCAYPAVYGLTGRKTFIINEGTVIFSGDVAGKPLTEWPYEGPPFRLDYEKID